MFFFYLPQKMAHTSKYADFDVAAGLPAKQQQHLQCLICQEMAEDARSTPCCNSLFCEQCIYGHLLHAIRPNACPVCSATISRGNLLKPHGIRNFIEEFKWKCRNEDCPVTGSIEELTKHQADGCEHELMLCKNKPCKTLVKKRDLLAHRGICEEEPVKCLIYCGLPLPRRKLLDHKCHQELLTEIARIRIDKNINEAKMMETIQHERERRMRLNERLTYINGQLREARAEVETWQQAYQNELARVAHLEVTLSRMAQQENENQQDEEERESSTDQEHIPVIVNQIPTLTAPAESPVSSIYHDSITYSPFPEPRSPSIESDDSQTEEMEEAPTEGPRSPSVEPNESPAEDMEVARIINGNETEDEIILARFLNDTDE